MVVFRPRRCCAVGGWREERAVDRFVLLAESDNRLMVDLDNILSVESFVHRVQALGSADLVDAASTPRVLSPPRSPTRPPATSMLMFRLLRTGWRAHETVIYDFLARLYTSEQARRTDGG